MGQRIVEDADGVRLLELLHNGPAMHVAVMHWSREEGEPKRVLFTFPTLTQEEADVLIAEALMGATSR